MKPLSLGIVGRTRVNKFVVDELKLCVRKKVILINSQCVLHWIKSDRQLLVFLQNRVDEIRLLKDLSVLFIFLPKIIPQILQLEDLQFQQSKLWWHGPSWLQSAERNGIYRLINCFIRPRVMVIYLLNVAQQNSDQVPVCTIDETKIPP